MAYEIKAEILSYQRRETTTDDGKLQRFGELQLIIAPTRDLPVGRPLKIVLDEEDSHEKDEK